MSPVNRNLKAWRNDGYFEFVKTREKNLRNREQVNDYSKMLKSIHSQFSAIEEVLKSKGLLAFLEAFKVSTPKLETDTAPTLPFIVPRQHSTKKHCENEDGASEIRCLKVRALEYLFENIQNGHVLASLVPQFYDANRFRKKKCTQKLRIMLHSTRVQL